MDKLQQSIELVREFEPLALQADPRGYCVCSSFGKDSMANIRVFQLAGVKFWIKWSITGIDPPELVYFAREQIQLLADAGIYTKKQMYEKSMQQMIVEHYIPPSRRIRYCCDELKERWIPEDVSCFHSFGVRKAESNARQGRNELEALHRNKNKRLSLEYSQTTDYEQAMLDFDGESIIYLGNDNTENRQLFENCAVKGVKAVNPLIYWTDAELWDFINHEEVPYCKLYDEGFKRLGCIGCPMASKSSREMEFKRYPKFYDYYLRAFRKMLERRKMDRVDERRIAEGKKPMPWKTPQDVMDWWLEKDINNDQLTLSDYEQYELRKGMVG